MFLHCSRQPAGENIARLAITTAEWKRIQKEKHLLFLFFNPTSVTEITNIANLLSNRKASGFDKITPLVLKTIIGDVVDVLVYLVNLSLTSGVFPGTLKRAIILPLNKKSEKFNPTNYRPIDLLSIFSKVLEQILKHIWWDCYWNTNTLVWTNLGSGKA